MTELLIALFALALLIVLARLMHYEKPEELTYEQALDRLNDSVNSFKISLGAELTPAMIQAAEAFDNFVKAWPKRTIQEDWEEMFGREGRSDGDHS